MQFQTLDRPIEDYRWAIAEMQKCPNLDQMETLTLMQLAEGAAIDLESFDAVRQACLIFRVKELAGIMSKCTMYGFPIKWPENVQNN